MTDTSGTLPLHCPIKSIYDIDPCDPAEVEPLAAHLRADILVDTPTPFPRGTVLPDGRLDLCKQSLGPGGCRIVTEALAGNTCIKSILLGTDGIGDTGAQDVADLVRRNHALETIYLGCNRISHEGTAPLCQAIGESPAVTGLWLKRNPIGPEGARHVADLLRRTRTLRTLDLVNTNIGSDGLAAVLDTLIYSNRTVERLYLGGNGISAADVPRIAVLLRRNPKIQALLLNVNAIGDLGAIQLADALFDNRSLVELGLASCGITATGGAALFAALRRHPCLAALDLGYSPSTRVLGARANTLGDQGAIDAACCLIAGAPFRQLDLRRNGIGPAGIDRLAAALQTNSRLCDLRLDGRADSRIAEALIRNRTGLGSEPILSIVDDVAMIRSVYRTAPPPRTDALSAP